MDYEESWAPKNWCFWTVVLEKTLESPLDCKEIQQVHPKRDQSWVIFGRTDAKAETPIFWPPPVKSWHIGKDSDAGRDWGQEEQETTDDAMAGWHHRLDGPEFGWTLGVGNGQGGLVCFNSWARKESDTTERLNWTEPTGVFPLPEHPGGLDTLDECVILVYWYGRRYSTHMTWWPQWNVISGTWMNALKRTETPE